VIPVYFLFLMADGRRLKERLPVPRASIVPDDHEADALFVTSEYPRWMAHPSGESEADKEPARADGIFS